MKSVCILTFLVAYSSCCSHVVYAQEPSKTVWPQWRGPTRDGQVRSQKPWPTKLSQEFLKLKWQVKLRPSYSSPIVTADRIFVTETIKPGREGVVALDRNTGKQLWKSTWIGGMAVPSYAKANGDWIRSTPAYDGESLYVGGMRDLLVCFNTKNGNVRWKVDFKKQYRTPNPLFGMVSSPLVHKGSVYVQAAVGVVRVDKKNGKVIWRVLLDNPKEFGGADASPILANLAGQKQLVVLNRSVVAGLDLETGKVFWKQTVGAFRNTTIVTPLKLKDDAIFVSMFANPSVRVDVEREKGAYRVRRAWTNTRDGYMSSPLRIRDHIYLFTARKGLLCLNAKTGKTVWVSDRRFGDYWSMVANNDQILALDEEGFLFLIQADPKSFRLLDQRRISRGGTWAHVAVCDDEIYVRGLDSLSVYRWRNPNE
ncbi:MAG: PQQ-binding-like beta-propeller repeat protein [Gemmataceae bacterium]